MKKLSLFASALSVFLLFGCAASDEMGAGMGDTMDQEERMEDGEMGHMDEGMMMMDKDKGSVMGDGMDGAMDR